jgi:hypothetical protein
MKATLMKKYAFGIILYLTMLLPIMASANTVPGIDSDVDLNDGTYVVHNSGQYGSQNMPFHSIETGTNQAKRIRNDSLASGLQQMVFILCCAAIGVVLLRKSNKR